MRIVALIVGLIAFLLGGLWLLQGLGLVRIQPILCFVDCAPLEEPSPGWAVAGAVALVAGGLGIFWWLRRR